MAKATLPVNFKDDIPNVSMNGKRRYRMTQNADGTVSFDDVTDYDQVGNNFGGAQINQTNAAVNASADASKIIDSLDAVVANTQKGYMAGALALKQVNNSLAQQPDFIYDASGKITGYKTPGGADTVFPFNSIDNLVSVFEDGAMYLRSGANINTPNLNNYKKIIVAIAGNWSDYAYGNNAKITDIDIFKKTPITISHSEGTVSITYISNTSIKVVAGARVAPCILLV